MQHEAIRVLTHQCIDLLFIACSTQSCDNQCLRFTTGKQCRTMSTRQDAGTDSDRTHGTCVATIDTRFAIKDLRTNDFCFQIEQDVADFG